MPRDFKTRLTVLSRNVIDTIQSAGSSQTTRPILNFVSGATVADNSGTTSTDVTAYNPADPSYWHQTGTTPDRRYCAGMITSTGTAAAAMTANVMLALPLPTSRGGAIDRVGCNVTTLGASSSVRTGIYTNSTTAGLLYPDQLVVESGAISSATTGVKEATISVTLAPNSLYWAVFTCNATAPSVSAMASTSQYMPIFGLTALYGLLSASLSVAFTFAALPTTFPSGATYPQAVGTVLPAIGYRWA